MEISIRLANVVKKVKVRYYGCATLAILDRRNNFVLTHVEYVDPEIVLQDDYFIMGLDDSQVWFSVIPKKVNLFCLTNN